MAIRQLRLNNFRNIEKLHLSPQPRLNVIWGGNGQGKTSLLEAIYLLANGKSFRTARYQEMVRLHCAEARLSAEIERQEGSHRLEMWLQAEAKERRLDGKVPHGSGEIFSLLQPILFTPDDVTRFKGGPAGRRELLDRAVFTCWPGYLQLVLDYGRVLRQRNRLLKERPSSTQGAWDHSLVEAGARVRCERARFVQQISPLFTQAYGEIAEGREQAELCYGHDPDIDQCRQRLEAEITEHAGRERQLAVSLVGPQRDDLDFRINGKHSRHYASQGQQRSLALAFKIALVGLVQRDQTEPPLLLLDDMTSELDPGREEYLINFLAASRGQIFITTTDRRLFGNIREQNAAFFRLADGQLEDF